MGIGDWLQGTERAHGCQSLTEITWGEDESRVRSKRQRLGPWTLQLEKVVRIQHRGQSRGSHMDVEDRQRVVLGAGESVPGAVWGLFR